MKNIISLSFALVAVVAQASAPVVSNVTFEQDARKVVHVRYALSGEPGIVTFECLTNGVLLAAELLTNADGAVNRLVQPASNNEIVWKARKTFRDQKFDTGVTFKVTAWATNCPPPYMVVDLSEANGAIRYYASAEAVPGGVTADVYKTDKMLFKKVVARGIRWRMGMNPEFYWRNDSDKVAQAGHYVMLSDDYYLGVYEFTNGYDAHCRSVSVAAENVYKPCGSVSYNSLRGTNTADFAGWPQDGHSVQDGSRLKAIRDYLGLAVDLPTEAQWEYACRAGTTSPFYYAPSDMVGSPANSKCKEHAWIIDNVKNGNPPLLGVQPVGHWDPNPWGFYDMYGNAGEWCLDWHESWAPASYAKDQVDPVGPTSGTSRAFRGGHVADGSGYANSVDRRYKDTPSRDNSQFGFRLACPVVMPR